MKILHIVNVYAPAGGIETYVIDLMSHLEAEGHKNVLIYRREHPRTLPANGKPVYHVPVTNEGEQDRKGIIDIVRDENPTVIYVHIFYPVCPGLGKLYRRTDQVCTRPYGLGCIPMIYLQRCASARHPVSVYNIMRGTKRYLEAYRSLPYVIVASEYMKDLMVQNGIEAERVKILPYFIPIPPQSEVSPPDDTCQDIMFAGRLDYEKGVPYLLEALRLIPPPHQLLIAGDGSLNQEYRQLADSMGVADRVQFLGWLSNDELKTAYQRCAVTVMPTIMPEPFGKVGVEAMANGRPVVAFDVGGIPDWLKDGYNGFLVPSRDVEQLADRLNQLLTDVDLAAKLGGNGRRYVEQNYSTKQHLDGLLSIMHNA